MAPTTDDRDPVEGSNLGRWARWYAGVTEPAAYGDTFTYELAAAYLAGLDPVEDWGCGKGYFGTVFDGPVIGVDGTETPFCSIVADLAAYRSDPAGIHMRHVLEHDRRWPRLLDNLLASARERFVLTIFTPAVDQTREIGWTDALGVPDIAFHHADLEGPMDAAGWEFERLHLTTATQYGGEIVYLGTR